MRRATAFTWRRGQRSIIFLSTPSARRATGHLYRQSPLPHISIHALREEGDLVVRELLLIVSSISIHALREGGDFIPAGDGVAIPAISIHALREEGDKTRYRRRTLCFNFYPRPPRGGRPGGFCFIRTSFVISIHALREEGDPQARCSGALGGAFLSTPSARRATLGSIFDSNIIDNISIHALREEGDGTALHRHRRREISIHALREEGDFDAEFYKLCPCISIHALREEGDDRKRALGIVTCRFLSTPSARRATLILKAHQAI